MNQRIKWLKSLFISRMGFFIYQINFRNSHKNVGKIIKRKI
ncbi:hypothetical protein CMALT430_230058 [Carnobacterium maltaromaticum]|nr:hypothetical protein CMALT430_230058 [Carnobacterium maltaromaticum]